MVNRITFVIPCRSNLPYLQQAVGSIEEHYGDSHDVVILDDASDDNSWDWITQYSEGRDNIITYRNEGPDRVGHTVLYDVGFDLAKTEVVSILHSDMVVTPNYVEHMLKHLKPKKVVSATRIEPPLHPPGPEKYVQNFGLEVDEFSEQKENFLNFVSQKEIENEDKITDGIFAPWMMYKEDFVEIGGHDFLFAPMELEDSDIFNRFFLNGYELIQSRDAFVYHMTCRGSRFKDGIEIEKEIPLPDGTIWYKPKDSEEYTILRQHKFREWWRKWHTDVLHDEFMMPIVPSRYDTGFIVKNCNTQILSILEPWCDTIYVDCDYKAYVDAENEKSEYDISESVKPYDNEKNNHILISFDASKLTNQHFTEFIKQLPFIIEETGQTGSFNWDIFQIDIISLEEVDMIKPHFKNIF
jgi:glycosyltransferase involved in cell wall biosynthesis